MRNAAGDGPLWARVARDDEQAFGVVFTRYADAVYGHCFRRTADWAAAEDLTSLVFLQAWRRRHQDTPDTLLPWLLGVANNLLRNHARTLRRSRSLVARLSVPPVPVPDPGEDVAERLDDARQMELVLAALRRLSRTSREVVELVLWDGLSYEDAAAALGVPVGTVRSRLSRARTRLAAAAVADQVGLPTTAAIARAAVRTPHGRTLR